MLGAGLIVLALALGRGGAPWSGSVLGLIAGAAVLGGVAVAVGAPCDAETRYHCARVDVDPQRPSGRTLVLENLKHSYVDLDDPRRLELDYIRWIGDAIDGMAPRGAPLDGVFLGGAGFTLPRYLLATRRGSRARVHEVDGELVELARERLGLRTGRDLRVVEGDARVTLAARPPPRPTCSSATRSGHARSRGTCRRSSTPARSGACCGRAGSTRSTSSTSRRWSSPAPRSRRCARCSPTWRSWRCPSAAGRPGGGNLVLLASETALPRGVRPTSRGARTYDRRAAARFAAGAEPLRDLDAPADQLLSRGG